MAFNFVNLSFVIKKRASIEALLTRVFFSGKCPKCFADSSGIGSKFAFATITSGLILFSVSFYLYVSRSFDLLYFLLRQINLQYAILEFGCDILWCKIIAYIEASLK